MINPRILIVDDEPHLSELVRLILEKAQRFEIRVENRSSLALSVAREFRPDMVILDIDMPGKDGGEVAQEIQADPVLQGVVILFLTSLITPTEAVERKSARARQGFMAKPVNARFLVDTVDRMLAAEAHEG